MGTYQGKEQKFREYAWDYKEGEYSIITWNYSTVSDTLEIIIKHPVVADAYYPSGEFQPKEESLLFGKERARALYLAMKQFGDTEILD